MKVSSVVGIDLHELIRLKPRFSKTQLLNIFSRDWSAWIDTIETFSYGWFWCYLHQVGIDLHELIRLKPLFILNSYIVEHIYVGIDLHELIRLKHSSIKPCQAVLGLSGLICMNWYDWNICSSPTSFTRAIVGIDLHELIRLKPKLISEFVCITKLCRDWSAWIDTIETTIKHFSSAISAVVGIDLHELIRLKHMIICSLWQRWTCVGIDLHELIRLKHRFSHNGFSIYLAVGIDLHELIRLKRWVIPIQFTGFTASGLICMNWYDWNFCGAYGATVCCWAVGIDLHELIRLKPSVLQYHLWLIY